MVKVYYATRITMPSSPSRRVGRKRGRPGLVCGPSPDPETPDPSLGRLRTVLWQHVCAGAVESRGLLVDGGGVAVGDR